MWITLYTFKSSTEKDGIEPSGVKTQYLANISPYQWQLFLYALYSVVIYYYFKHRVFFIKKKNVCKYVK